MFDSNMTVTRLPLRARRCSCWVHRQQATVAGTCRTDSHHCSTALTA